MKTIVAATDMSVSSKASLRFAMRLATAMNAHLHIVHVHYVMRASIWNDREYQAYLDEAAQIREKELAAFVRSIRLEAIAMPEMMGSTAYHHIDVVDGILEYAAEKKADYICVGTHGAGLLGRIIGSNTLKLIGRSTLPVLSVPRSYKQRNVIKVLYAADMANWEKELQQVVGFVRPIGAELHLVHFYPAYEFVPDRDILEQTLEKRKGYKIQVHYVPRDPRKNLIDDIEKSIALLRPSLLVLFTHQDRDLVDRLISPSTTRDYAFIAKVPLLSFPKGRSSATGPKTQTVRSTDSHY